MLRSGKPALIETRMRFFGVVPALVVAVAGFVVAAQAPDRTPAQVAAALQQKYDGIRDFSADFVHEYEGGVLKKKLRESGTVQVKKPGKMKWTYKVPEQKLFISDGVRLYFYVPADKQVIVSRVPQEDQATSAVLFLMGKGNLTRDFTVSFIPGGPPDTYNLKLLPRLPERDYDWLEISVDRNTFQIRTLSAGDKEGGRSTFTFSNFKENTGLSDNTFAFKIPRGTDVITSTAPSGR
jgi:outer membrane lipoprotein carrier protein